MHASPRTFARAVESWFSQNRRGFPWRTPTRDPYHALVAETMLQQTQASRVAERFPEFVRRFPTVRDLADAPERDVLALWSGLGYYRRARNLHAAARHVRDQHNSEFPTRYDDILALPGVGRYTAGAIRSIALDQPAPIVDANVARVLLRVTANTNPPDDTKTRRQLWDHADILVKAADSPAALNEGLMELGALVCTPRNPRCDDCPLSTRCLAQKEGLQQEIPSQRPKPARKPITLMTLVVRDNNSLLVHPRPSTGLWGSMYQPPTAQIDGARPNASRLRTSFNLERGPERVTAFEHKTTHRDVRFVVYRPDRRERLDRIVEMLDEHRWISHESLDQIPLSSPHRRIITGAFADDLS